MLNTQLQPGKLHILPSGEVFSIFFIIAPVIKKAAKVSCLPLRLKDFLILMYLNYFLFISYANTFIRFMQFYLSSTILLAKL